MTITGKTFQTIGTSNLESPITDATVTAVLTAPSGFNVLLGQSTVNATSGDYTITTTTALNPATNEAGIVTVQATSATYGNWSQTSPVTLHASAAPTSAGTTSSSGTTKATQGAIVTLPNPIKCNDATCLVTQVIRYVLGIVAVIATLMFVWGGVLMLTSGGNSDQVRKAKETLTWAAIGVIVILMSWVIIKFVLQAVTGTTS